MKKIKSANKKIQKIIYIILLSAAGALILILITGTIIGIAHSGSEPFFGSASQTEQAGIFHSDDIRVSSGSGRLRIPLANSSTLILSIAFPYSADDAAFAEELALKAGDLRTFAADYFSNLPEENLIHIDEDSAKKEILRRYNAILRLGRIDVLYFNDMMIIDSIE